MTSQNQVEEIITAKAYFQRMKLHHTLIKQNRNLENKGEAYKLFHIF